MSTATNNDELVTIFAQLRKSDLPQPGSWVQVDMSNGMSAQLWNLRDGRALTEMASHSLHYVPVVTVATRQRVVHAAINRRRNGRNRTERYTICSKLGDDAASSQKRIVSSIITGTLDDTVTCEQCRNQLIEDGVIASPSG